MEQPASSRNITSQPIYSVTVTNRALHEHWDICTKLHFTIKYLRFVFLALASALPPTRPWYLKYNINNTFLYAKVEHSSRCIFSPTWRQAGFWVEKCDASLLVFYQPVSQTVRRGRYPYNILYFNREAIIVNPPLLYLTQVECNYYKCKAFVAAVVAGALKSSMPQHKLDNILLYFVRVPVIYPLLFSIYRKYISDKILALTWAVV